MARQKKQPASVRPEESAIVAKYPTRNFDPGSFRMPGEMGNPYPRHRCITLICLCGERRILPTSDIWHITACVQCSKDVKRGRQTTKAAKKATTSKKEGK